MTFSILDHLEKLEPAKEKGKYICPVCEGNDLAVSPKTGAYSCFSGGCDTADIRNAIAPLPNGHQPQGHGSRKPKGRRLSEREKDRAAQQKASAVETKVDELLLSVAGGWHTKEEALIELGQWAKLEDFDAWDAKQLFKVRAKDNRIGEKVAEQPGIEVGSVSIEAHMLDGHFGGGAGDVITIDDTYYRYSNGHWQPCSDKQVMAEIALALKTRYKWSEGRDPKQLFTYATNSNKSAVYSYCRDALHKEIDPSSNRHLRAFLNGTVDMRRGTIHPHRRDDYLTRAIAANYAPGADCPEVFRQFVESSFGPEMLRFIRALVSMYIDPTAPYGYAAHFIGPSGSGKGTMIRLLKSLFSETSAKSLGSFDDIATPEDRHQYLTGAELVAFPDLAGYQRGKGLQAFYELVDNGGMAGRALFSSSSYDKRWYCRFVLGSVTHLAVDNASDGWARRVIPVPTRHRKGDVDPRLGDKLEQVKGDIISWALAMPKEERDSIIARPERYSEAIAISIEDAALAGDSVRAFVDACLVPGDPSVEMGKANLHEAYRAFCQAMGFQAKERTKFLHLLKLILPGCHIERHRGKDATGQRCMVPSRWVGLQFVSGLFHEPEHSTSANPAYHCISSRLSEGGIDALLNEGGSDARGGGSDGGSDAREGASDPPQIQLGQGFSEIGSDGSDGSHVRLTLGDSFHSIDSKKEGETVQNPSDGYFSSEPSDPPSDPTLETSTMQGLSVDQMPPSGASDPHPKASDPTGASDPHSGAKLIHRRTGEIATMVRGDEDGFIWVSPADGGENRLVAASDWRAIAG